MNLALGTLTDFGFDWSIRIAEAATPRDVASMLQEKTKGSNCCGTDAGLWPDRILMIKNGDLGPEVFARYHIGLDYPREGQTHFVDWKKNHVVTKGL